MNKIVFGLILLIASGCNSGKDGSLTTENSEIVKSMFDAFNKHDWRAMADHYIDSASFLDPSFGKEYVIQSKTDMVAKYQEMQKLFPDIHDKVIGVYPSGNKVSVEFVSTGTMADGTKFILPISCILTLKDGKIVKDATYYDQ